MNAKELSWEFEEENRWSSDYREDLQSLLQKIWDKACEAQKNHTGAVLQDGKIRIYHTEALFNIE